MQAQMIHEQKHDIFKAKRWENGKKDIYLLNMDKIFFHESEIVSDGFGESKNKQQRIDYISESISSLLTNAAFTTFGKNA